MKKIFLTLVLLITLGFIGCVSFFALPSAHAVTLSEVELKTEYMLNDELTIPTATLTVDGKTETADHIIIYPSGKAYDKSDVVLDELGKYEIEYSAYFNHRKYSKTLEFNVINSLYSFDYSDTATAKRYSDYQLTEFDGTVSSLDGLLVELPKDAVFKYNKIIDLTNMGKDDELVTFSILPEVLGMEDFQHLFFRLSDINDPSNYVTISFHDVQRSELTYGVVNDESVDVWPVYSYTLHSSYAKAGASFQSMVGKLGSYSEKIHENDDWGHMTPTSFHGTPTINAQTGLSSSPIGGSQTSVNFDYAEREIYVDDNTGIDLVTDLDSKQFYYRLWDGFSDGKAYLSMWAEDYTSKNPAKVFIYDIAGDNLTDTKLIDKEAPVIKVDYLGLDKDSLPNGIVGYPYPLLSATSKDVVDAYCDVTSLVYYNYNSSNRALCNVVDGKFTPTRSGKYTVINQAVDKSGNIAEEIYTIDVVSEEYEVNISVSNTIKTCNIGTKISLGEVEIDLPNGFYTLETTVESNSKTYTVEDSMFVPKQKGNHTVLYTVKDFLGRTFEYSYEFECITEDAAVIFDKAVFNKYLISGITYDIPSLEAYDFSTDNNGKLVSLENYLIDSNGRNKVSGTFVPFVNESGKEVTIEYAYNGVVIQSYTIPCFVTKNDNGIDMTKYFATVAGSFDITASAAGVALSTTKDNTKAEFINYLTADQFKLEFKVNKEKNYFNEFVVYLKDAYDETNQIKVTFKKDGMKSTVKVNDYKDSYKLNSSFVDDTQKFQLVYDSISNIISTDDDLGVSISLTDFDGFESNMIIVSFEFVGVIGASEVILSNLDGQPLNNQTIDAISPKLVFDGEYKKRYSINTDFQLFKAYSSDVLSPSITFTLTVKDPNGKVVKSVDGITLENVIPDEYIISLDQYGKYSLVYKVTDGNGRSRQYIINLDVSDEIKPELHLSSEEEINVKVGETVYIPTATATDNLDTELKIFVYLENPNGASTPLQGTFNYDTYFRPTVKGTYKVKYIVTDSSGNFVMKTVIVNVK